MSEEALIPPTPEVELANAGQRIAEIGGDLKKLRMRRSELDSEIDLLEQELRPLLQLHAKLIADMSGVSVSAPMSFPQGLVEAPQPTAPRRAPPQRPMGLNQAAELVKQDLRKRVMEFLENVDDDFRPTATRIADELGENPEKVREAMAAIARAVPSIGDDDE